MKLDNIIRLVVVPAALLSIVAIGVAAIVASIKQEPPVYDRYSEGFRAGVQHTIECLVDDDIYLSPLEIRSDMSISNCIFVQVIKSDPSITIGGGDRSVSNIWITSCTFCSIGLSQIQIPESHRCEP